VGKRPRILSPVKSFEEGIRVIGAGADELYCGVTIPDLKEFVLYRGTGCEIPSYDEFEKLARYAHGRKIPVLVTVNQPFMTKTIEKSLRAHVRSCVDMGADALIVGDLGVMTLIRNVSSNVPIYASTYLASTNYEAVGFLEELGFDRVILERHLLLDEIRQIVEKSRAEVEVFIHGAGCSNINGSCYLYHYNFPQLNSARSVIEGVKVPCRIPFKVYDAADKERMIDEVPIMDWLEYCSLCKIPELMRIGVKGFKIEGRGANLWYKESTTRMYRELIDMLSNGETVSFQDRLRSLKTHFYPIPPVPTNLQETFCDQERCYYGPLFHAPYKYSQTMEMWTRSQFCYWMIQK